MIFKRSHDIPSSEITSSAVYERRREFMELAAGMSMLCAVSALPRMASAQEKTLNLKKLDGVAKSRFSASESPTAYKHVTEYNNYYEFGTDKTDPARYAARMKVMPWTVAVDGEVGKPRT